MFLTLNQTFCLASLCFFYHVMQDKLPADAPKGGIIRVITPDIANLLPLLVYDEYKGYDVKIIPDFTQEELDR